MTIKRLLLTVVFLLALPAVADTVRPELAVKEHIRFNHEGGGDAFVFVVQGEDLGGPATLGAIELATGERVFLLAKFDPKSGVAFQRLDDLSTGWYAELVVESGLQHLAEPGTVGGGSTSTWLEHVIQLTHDPSFEETISIQTVDGAFVTWQASGGDSADLRQEKEDAAIQELAPQIQESVPPPTSRRAVALVDTLISDHDNSMLDHFEDLIKALGQAFENADLPALSHEGRSQVPRSVRVPLSDSEAEIKRLRRSLKLYVRSSMD